MLYSISLLLGASTHLPSLHKCLACPPTVGIGASSGLEVARKRNRRIIVIRDSPALKLPMKSLGFFLGASGEFVTGPGIGIAQCPQVTTRDEIPFSPI